MATKKREIYARAAVQLRTHDRCREAEEECPGAMGLYLFLLLQARGEETAGHVSRSAALESWSAPKSYRAKQVAALVKAGLVEEQDGRLVVSRYLDHNDGPDEIAANRAAATERKRASRKAHVTRDTHVTPTVGHVDVSSSISCSSSLSGSSSRSEEPTSTPRAIGTPANDAPPLTEPTALVGLGEDTPPAWWEGACDTVSMTTAMVDDRPARWLEYRGSVERKGWVPSQRHAVSWLSQVIRRERREGPRSQRGPGGGPRGDRQGLDLTHAHWLPTGTEDPFRPEGT